jgi:tetraacyldisaccharide-1-P 4'-kinase
MIVVEHGLRGRVERLLTREAVDFPAASMSARLRRALASRVDAWDRRRTAEPLELPPLGPTPPLVLTVAGVTRGGSWKTPFAVSLVDALSARGLAVGLVMRGYRGRDRSSGARLVATAADARLAGDEAFAAFRHFHLAAERRQGPVGLVVASSVSDGVARLLAGRFDKTMNLTSASTSAVPDLVVIDGVRQAPSAAQGLGFVTFDAPHAEPPSKEEPRFPPGFPAGFGLALSTEDRVLVPVVDGGEAKGALASTAAEVELRFETERGRGGDVRSVARDEALRLAGARPVVVTTHARPERFLRALERRGLVPHAHLRLSDHADSREVLAGLDALERKLAGPLGTLVFADKAALAMAEVRPEAPRLVVRCELRLGAALLSPVFARLLAAGATGWIVPSGGPL